MKSSSIDKIAAFAMVIILLFIFIKRYVYEDNLLIENYQYTEATIYKISYPVDGGPDTEFKYIVNNIEYKDYIPFDSRYSKPKVGDKYVLKYYPPNPKIARLLYEKPITTNGPEILIKKDGK